MEFFLSSKNLLILLLFIFIFSVNSVNSEYPEDCAVYDDKFCYVLEETPMTSMTAKHNCSARGGETGEDMIPRLVYDSLARSRKSNTSCYWDFDFEDEEHCFLRNFGVKCEVSCYSALPSICKIPWKECKLSDLRKAVPNAYFRNCEESSPPKHEITVECKQGYILQKGSNIVKCNFDGKWSHTPECKQGCLTPKVSNNSYLLHPKEKYTVGERAEIWCKNGFISLRKYPMTSIFVTCLKTGFWSDFLPDCLPVNNLFYHYDFTKEKYFKKRIAIGDQITLHVCNLDHSYEGLDKSISWLKDQVEFTSLQGGQKLLNETDFNLQFFNFSREDEGVYTCIIKNKNTSSVLDFCVYQLQLSKECPQKSLEHSISLNLHEGTDQILTCSTNRYIYKVIWFKDEERLQGDNNHIPMPDGSLYFRNMSVLDEGNYLCTYKDLENSCERKSKITVTIIRKVVCGRLDGDYSTKLARPWLATLWNDGEMMPFCYATLINSNWLVTSATCLSGFQRKHKPDFLVKLGVTSDFLETSTSSYDVLKVRMHPNYSKRHRFYDIGLIKLKDNVIYTNDIYPICYFGNNLHAEDSCNEFQSGTITGWGPLESVREVNKVELSSEILNIVNSTECNYLVRSKLPDYMFCAKGMDGAQDFAGDSGSSFEIKWKNHWYLWGVMSWGDRITDAGTFDYFTKIIYFEEWVQLIIES